eukprot:Blabericola_migrator_1__6451@NODE_3254_length_1907_cov_133_324457_g2036_i0_p2_GENE_NODE_3254_length_1907_cov_133_324457_g2036_i0NODE_3254_length_1907_cov_133_324457_g2036_i0_p2_ORF_typecomplete_len193_score14_13DUF3995/PF13160_6/6_4e03DUF3995/PF13160_6/0_038_NODE_3254_length_1907_cov_133_324457_g2036_i0221799
MAKSSFLKLKTITLAFVLSVVVVSHLIYFGCETKTGTFSLFERKNVCPNPELLPRTPVQVLILEYFGWEASLAGQVHEFVCPHVMFGPPKASCALVYAFSILAGVAEWCFYAIVAAKIIKTLVLAPIFKWILRSAIAILSLLLIARLVGLYSNRLLPPDQAQNLSNLAAEVEDFAYEPDNLVFCSSCHEALF